MLKFVMAGMLAMSMAVSAAAAPLLAGFNDEEMEWHDLESGLAKAAETGQTAVVVVHATWCPTCKKYRKVFFDPEVVEASKDFVFIIIDGDEERELAERYAPDGPYIPRTMIVKASGELVSDIQGPDSEYKYFLNPSDALDLLIMMDDAKALTH